MYSPTPRISKFSPFEMRLKGYEFLHFYQQSECRKVLHAQCYLRIQNEIFNLGDEVKEIKKTNSKANFEPKYFEKYLFSHFQKNLL